MAETREDCKQLHRVSQDELPALHEWLTSHLPHSWKICYSVKYALDGKWRSLTFYTLGWPGIRAVAEGLPDETCQIKDYYIHPLRISSIFSPSTEDARTILTFPGFIDWKKPIMFQCVADHLTDTIISLCKELTGETIIQYPNYLMAAKEGTLTDCLECPEGMSIRDLDPERDGEFAVANWPHQRPGADSYIKALVGNYRSVGLFDKEDKCIGYEMSTEYGTMGMLFVRPEYRGKGLGGLITHRMAQHKWREGMPAAVTVIKDNAPSVRLHERIGFKIVCAANWIANMPWEKVFGEVANGN